MIWLIKVLLSEEGLWNGTKGHHCTRSPLPSKGHCKDVLVLCVFVFLYLCICIFVFVYLHFNLCICIFAFVYLHLYLPSKGRRYGCVVWQEYWSHAPSGGQITARRSTCICICRSTRICICRSTCICLLWICVFLVLPSASMWYIWVWPPYFCYNCLARNKPCKYCGLLWTDPFPMCISSYLYLFLFVFVCIYSCGRVSDSNV